MGPRAKFLTAMNPPARGGFACAIRLRCLEEFLVRHASEASPIETKHRLARGRQAEAFTLTGLRLMWPLLNQNSEHRAGNEVSSGRRTRVAKVPVDVMPFRAAVRQIAGRPAEAAFAYVVTPNVDHIVRADRDAKHIVPLYEHSWLSLCDSQVLRLAWWLVGVDLPLTAGADLTKTLLEEVVDKNDPVSVVGASERTIDRMRQRYGLRRVYHYIPPMGFIADQIEITRCVDFVVSHPARFVFFAVGSPQQEKVAFTLSHVGEATGLGLCIGAALDFAVGILPRAPWWVQRCGFEWLHRLSHEPRRLSRRYLVDDIAIAPILVREILKVQKNQ